MKRYLLLFFLSLFLSAEAANAIRAAIDVGSGGPKLRIAEVDLTTNKIVKILHVKQYPVIFQQDLSKGGSRMLSPETMTQGLHAIHEAIALAKSFEAEGIVMIGTSVFRNALNGKKFAGTIYLETGLMVHVLDQELEGKLAFEAASAHISTGTDNLVVWDIGGGSTQFIGTTAEGHYLIDGSDEGSGPFRDFIIESIQNRNIKHHKSPNPISHDHACLAESYASSLSLKVDPVFRDKIPSSEVIGVGSVFGRGIASLLRKNRFSIEDLAVVIKELLGKTDADLGGGDFACIEVSNALLVMGFMKGLGIHQIRVIDVNNAEGAMIYKPFW